VGRRGFSLVELLVVISVIALLMAILLPVLRKAKEAAREVVCRSNLRGIGIGIQMYLQNNDDRFPREVPNDLVIDAAEAERIGMVNQIVPDDKLEAFV
jgi:prepilin-type N-terminal cleavage/methylation domain-containing protein